MNIIKDFIPVTNINRPNRHNSCLSITIHNTDNTAKGANAKSHAEYIKRIPVKTSWHYTVDDKQIYQHIPDTEASYHTNNREGNDTSIAIEICMNSDGDIKKATDNAVWLVKQLRNTHGKIPLKQHYDWSKKNCPSQLREGIPYTWSEFVEKCEGCGIMTKEEAIKIIQNACGFDKNTMKYLSEYKYGSELLIRIAKAIKRI